MTDKQIIIYKKECYNEPHCSLNQVLEQLNAYKMEADEGKEINAELKAENEEWKKANDCILTTLNVIAEGNKKLRQTLTEIKEIAERCGKRIPLFEIDEIAEDLKQILQKISECEVK
jgi:hypothetical protein